MRGILIVLASVGAFFGIITANAAECPNNRHAIGIGHVISVDPTKHARHDCTQKHHKAAASRQYQERTRQAKLLKFKSSVIEVGKPVSESGRIDGVGSSYRVAGRTYIPHNDPNYRAEGRASWYGNAFHGRLTANGEIFNMNALSAAHPTLPLPSYVRVTNLENYRSLVVRVNDRGPYRGHRLIDVSMRAAMLLGFYDRGLAQVRVEYLDRAEIEGSDNDRLAATLRYENQSAAQLAANAPAGPDTANPLPINRKWMQPQCTRPHSANRYPQSVNFNCNWIEDINCKLAISETKIVLSLLETFQNKYYCPADHAPTDELPSGTIIPH
jgi:rare lipoprotein A (peptidoglycan hydrolase)